MARHMGWHLVFYGSDNLRRRGMTLPTPPGALMTELRRLDAQGEAAAAAELLERILEAHPDFMPAHRWRIDALLGQGEPGQALALARETQPLFPEMESMATVRQATALDRLGQTGAALRLLLALYEDGARDIPALMLLGTLLFRDGSLDRAEQLFQKVRAAHPDHPGAMRGLIDIALKRGQPQAVLDLCDRAAGLNLMPHHLVQTRRAQCLMQLDRSFEAIEMLTALVATPEATEQDWMSLAWLQRKVGNLEAATQSFGAVLAKTPGHVSAVQGQVAVLRQKGTTAVALAVCDVAIGHASPAPDVFHILRAQVLVAAGRAAQAAAALEQVRAHRTGSGPLHLELGRAHVQAGDLDKAYAAFETSRLYKDTRLPSLLEQAQIARQQGKPAQVVTLLRTAADSLEAPDPRITLALCEALIRTDNPAEVASLLQELVDHDAVLSDAQIEQMLILSVRQTLPQITCHLITVATDRAALSLRLALRLLDLAHITAEAPALRQIVAALCARVPMAERDVFRAEAMALIDGPEAAIALARRTLNSDQMQSKARIIGRCLVDGGRAGLAMRYLRRALHNWPENRQLITLYIHACGVSRHYDTGHAYLDQMVALAPDVDVERERLRLAYGQGATQAVLDRATARHDAGLPGLHPRQFLLLCLACGDLKRALSAQHGMRNDPNSNSQMAAYFTNGLHGRMLTDLQVYRALEGKEKERGQAPDFIEAKLAEHYYFPAKRRVDQWASQTGGAISNRGNPVPKRIFQYWGTDRVPDDVAALIEDWKDVPDFEHVLLNRNRAMTMLRRQFGPRFVSAFQRARHVTEESDLLRLCLIYKFGGIYSDADDKVVGDIATLAGLGAGLVVTREPIGAIANNILIAPAGNPILRMALDMTFRALMARDADGAWFKSGPGMLTRAVAVYLRDADPDEARRTLTLLDGDTLRNFIEPHIRLPYKTTAKYWNAQDKDISLRVLAGLIGLAPKSA
jgi:predicted Zn-dependent protease/mannosyltransferase OCH1-like enzyme